MSAPAADPRRVIETPRLVLRPHRPDDFDAYAAMWSDPAVTRFIGGRPFTREQSWTRFLRVHGLWSVLGFGSFAIEDRESGAFLGEAGFHDLRRDVVPSLEGTLETGWVLVPAAHGRGIASEAVGAVLGWAGAHFPDRRITCMIEPAHAASIRVAARQGFREFARTHYLGTPVLLFERTA